LNRQRFESPIIKTVSDIKRVLVQLEPNSRLNVNLDDVTLAVNMIGTNTDNHSRTFHVSAKTKTNSIRNMLLDGLNVVKQREDTAIKISDKKVSVTVNGTEMISPAVISENSFLAIDPVINRTLGGYRNGHFVQWDLSDGFTYRYDIFAHRLTRFKKEPQ
jgi:hypothetical protein